MTRAFRFESFRRAIPVLNDPLWRERFIRGESRARLLAAAAFHADIKAEQLLLIKMVYGADTDALSLLNLFHSHWSHSAQFRPGKEQVQRAGDGVE